MAGSTVQACLLSSAYSSVQRVGVGWSQLQRKGNERVFPSIVIMHPTVDLHCNPFLLNYSAKFGICTVVGLNGTLVEDKMRTF